MPHDAWNLEATDSLTRRARQVDARAATRADIVLEHDGRTQFPRYLGRAAGAYVWDLDGNRYIDFCLGYGPVILGHGDARVNERAAAATANGGCFAPLWSPLQVSLAELLVEVIPGAEMCLLVKTGSDATSAAVRLARIHTGRDKVLRWGYNGWHDWSVDQQAGIPQSVQAQSEEFNFYDLGALERQLHDNADNVACVLTMPFWDDEVDPMHLAAIRDLAHLNGALFVLDEMRSGFRVALGGAQEFFGLQADLAAYGKAMGNGHPISAVVGRREILLKLSETKISSTFFADPGPMAAAIATIQILQDTDALAAIWDSGEAFKAELVRLSSHLGDLVQVVGYPPMPYMRFSSEASEDDPLMVQRFFATAAARGVLLHPDHQWFVSAAHNIGVIDQALTAIETALDEI